MGPRAQGWNVAGNGHLPCLAVPYANGSADPMVLAEAADGLCRIAWVIDGEAPGMATLRHLLARLGPVVDIGGLGPDDAAGRLAPEAPLGIVPFHDEAIPLGAALGTRLGLAGADEEGAGRLVDKLHQRDALAAKGIEVPGHWRLPAGAGRPLEALPAGLRYPVVVKPRRGSGSKATFLALDEDELVRRIAEERAAALAAAGRDTEAAGLEMVAEEYLEGDPVASTAFADYLSAELAVEGGRAVCLALSGRLPLAEPFRETGLFLPSDLGETEAKAVSELAEEAVLALGAPPGCYHVEVKLTPAGPRIIEVNGRAGGTVPDLLQLATSGFSLFRLAFRLALGESLETALGDPDSLRTRRVAFRRLLQAPVWATRVEQIEGLDDIDRQPFVTSIATRLGPGSAVSWREGTPAYVARVTGVVDDYEQLRASIELIDEHVRVRYTSRAGSASSGRVAQ